MKKYIIFLLTIILLIGVKSLNAHALTFHEAEYIDGIYTKSVREDGYSKFQKARIFRRDDDNTIAYCAEPFKDFDPKVNYGAAENWRLDENMYKFVSKIIDFGYGYKDHTDPKWYAVSQVMIWRSLEPLSRPMYFTNGLNGPRIEIFQEEMDEISRLINWYDTEPKLVGKTSGYVGDTLTLTDENNVISDYKTPNEGVEIKGNQVIIKNIQKGTREITFTRNSPREGRQAGYYYSETNQSLITPGQFEINSFNIKVTGKNNKIIIIKNDSETGSVKNGEAELDGAVIGIYDEKDNLVRKVEIKNQRGQTTNIDNGKYYLKEIKPGKGYNLNQEKIDFEVTDDRDTIILGIVNKVIKKEITIHKEYGKENLKSESGITFEITDKNGNKIKEITTDNEGNAKAMLPYGTYKVSQKNTTEGYQKVEDFEIVVDDNDNDYVYKLFDYKIDVPNSGIEEGNSLLLLLFLIFPVLILKKCYTK